MSTEARNHTQLPHSKSVSNLDDGSVMRTNKRPKSRPVSFYDNCIENGNANNTSTTSSTNSYDVSRRNQNDNNNSPTQAYLLLTTVPQNMAAQNIANKHTPTRNSLRHSRMIAMNTSGRVPRKYLPAIIRYHKLAKSILGLIILLGSALCFLSLWLLLWAPNIRHRDNPHWSAIPVLISGIIGIILLCCFRKEYPGMKRSYFVYSFKVLSISLSTIGAVTSFIAFAFAIIHLVSLYTMACAPPDNLNQTCICFTPSSSSSPNNDNNNNNDTTIATTTIHSYHYVDLSCTEVDNILTILIIFSCGTNLFAGMLEIWYLYLHWASRYIYTYSKVRTDDKQQPTIFTNDTTTTTT